MEDLFASLTERLAAWVTAVTGAAVAPEDFRLPRREGQLSLGAFVQGDALGAARALTQALSRCPDVEAVLSEGGWLLFFLSDGWFEKPENLDLNKLYLSERHLDVKGPNPEGAFLIDQMVGAIRTGDFSKLFREKILTEKAKLVSTSSKT